MINIMMTDNSKWVKLLFSGKLFPQVYID